MHVLASFAVETEPALHAVHVVEPSVENRPAGHSPQGGVDEAVHSCALQLHMLVVASGSEL